MSTQKEQGDYAYDLDHMNTYDRQEEPDTNGDPEGSEERARTKETTPLYVLKDFAWVFNARANKDKPEDVANGKNWTLRARQTTVDTLVQACGMAYDARKESNKTNLDMVQFYDDVRRDILELLRTIGCISQWAMFGTAIQLVEQGAKEVASGSRFAMRAGEWQERDPEAEGALKMISSAYEQTAVGTALIDAAISAYHEASEDGAQPLRVTPQTWTSAAYKSLGIEASTLRKKHPHPGMAKAAENAGVAAATADIRAFFGQTEA